jgi:hypothetical protein
VTGRSYALPLAILLGVVVRVPFWVEALRTPVDGDMAIVGLMARHPGVGTTLWGQPYGSPLEAWAGAPLLFALGHTPQALRLWYFLLGLALIPAAYLLGRAVDPRAALPAAVLLACPPPYLLLLASLPPPLYPGSLLLGAALLVLAIRLRETPTPGGFAAWGAVAGLALWNHLMMATVVAASAGYLAWRARAGLRPWVLAILALAAGSAPWWARALADRQATRIVSVTGRQETMGGHLAEVLPRLHQTIGGLLGTHVPLVADDAVARVSAHPAAAVLAVLLYVALAGLALARARRHPPALLLAATATLVVVAFPFPLRSGPGTIRFLTPLYLPLAVLVVWGVGVSDRPRRTWTAVLALAAMHLATGTRLLGAWRGADRAAAPFLLPDLGPVRRALESQGIRRAYASYGPAYRLTFESGERIVASQPWNERFLHYPLPYLDEVDFAKNVAWVLTPSVPTDLPPPHVFEAALHAIGGTWRRTDAGAAVVYHGFEPPFGSTVDPWPGGGPLGDGDPATFTTPDAASPVVLGLPAPRALAAITLVGNGPRLPRSLDVEVSADGATFETVASRRRRAEREDLRWVNGHPQYVLDHDLLAIPLGGRTVAAVRITPVQSGDAWGLAEVLLHPVGAAPQGWGEWLDPNLGWAERRAALHEQPLPTREDWHYRVVLAERAGR